MKSFDENIPEQELIHAEELYYRSTYHHTSGAISPARPTLCCCGEAYDPDETSAEHIMHFCSRCRRWLHRKCLSSPLPSRRVTPAEFLQFDPDTNSRPLYPFWSAVADDSPSSVSSTSERPSKRPRLSTSTPDSLVAPDLQVLDDHISGLPADLVKLATRSVIRGGPAGVVGNGPAVIEARRKVCQFLCQGDSTKAAWLQDWRAQMPAGWDTTLPEGWDTVVKQEPDVVLKKRTRGRPRKTVPVVVPDPLNPPTLECPDCHNLV
ncbi:unnamed protein product [Mycena citricolor]|uniref:Uncharacterized protein n=1 Tax=Mycena citricolor TaxID=2018698 RepID=A0AAD2HLU0_9AGAR|nr:unnamed protein product [Mycena citricolor]